MMLPLFAELCAGTAALSLRLHGGKNARPPVSRMGNKQGYSSAILRTLGLRSGSGAARYLWCEPDDGCRLLLTSYTDADLRSKAAKIIRSWADQDPRKLWERLRAEGPVKSPPVDPREVARWLTVQGWAYAGTNLLDPAKCGIGNIDSQGRRWGVSDQAWIAGRLSTLPTLPATILPDARAVDPREVARWIRLVTSNRLINVGPDFQNTGQGGSTHGGDAFCTSIPELLDAMDRVPDHPPASILPDARDIDPPQLPPGSVVYIDPHYVNTTGYAHDLGRKAVCELAERWASAGAWVVISEAEPLAELGWHQVEITGERIGQKRTFSKQQREYLTMSQPPRWRPSVQHTLFSMAAK